MKDRVRAREFKRGAGEKEFFDLGQTWMLHHLQ